MSSKKIIIDKSRFEHIKEPDKTEIPEKSRFDMNFETSDGEKIELIALDKLKSAPKSWNFYKKLPDDKFIELIDSIKENFLLNPIIVWEQDTFYMILSGHNRADAFKKLFEITRDAKYSKIPAIIKSKTDVSQEEAKQIIIDTNWVQRQLSTYEKTMSILNKYAAAKNLNKGGKTRDIVAQAYGISGRMVQNYLSLVNLVDEMYNRIEEKKCSIKQAVEIARKSADTQKIIADNIDSLNLDVKKIRNLPETADLAQVLAELGEDEDKYISISVKIPLDKKESFCKFFEEWKGENL